HHPFRLEIAKKIAKERGGLCISNQCKATKEVLQWKCFKGQQLIAMLYMEKIGV
ncbi:16229_t:CDS:1, partial [Funneliformis caledonium]